MCGSPTSKFFFDLSLLYAKDVYLPSGWKPTFLVVNPSGKWQIGDSLSTLTSEMTFKAIVPMLSDNALVLPHLFCKQGMTTFRYLFENILGLALLGSSAHVMSLSEDKVRTREAVASNGVRVPKGELLLPNSIPSLPFPLVVKPNAGDNSVGVSLVRGKHELSGALERARAVDPYVLAEEFISGRELRVGVIELNGKFHIPSIIEYPLDEENPIRSTNDKLEFSKQGALVGQSTKSRADSICPAVVSPTLLEVIRVQAIKAHKAVGARHYSLFDFRINEKNQEPFFLEAGLYWSFSPASMITKMLKAGDEPVGQIIADVWNQVI